MQKEVLTVASMLVAALSAVAYEVTPKTRIVIPDKDKT